MKHKKVWAAVLAAVLCFAGALTGCKAGTFDKIEQAYLSCPDEEGAQRALLRRSEETALVDEAIAFVKDVPFEALDEAEAEAFDRQFPPKERLAGTPSQLRFAEVCAMRRDYGASSPCNFTAATAGSPASP